MRCPFFLQIQKKNNCIIFLRMRIKSFRVKRFREKDTENIQLHFLMKHATLNFFQTSVTGPISTATANACAVIAGGTRLLSPLFCCCSRRIAAEQPTIGAIRLVKSR